MLQRFAVLLTALLFIQSASFGQTLVKKFDTLVGNVQVGPVQDTKPVQVPYLTWSADLGFFVANGGLTTSKPSIYADLGQNYKFVNGDNFPAQVADYVSGKSPYLRGTVDMLAMASDVINKSQATKPIVFLQLSWSKGDHVVAREGIKNLNDLKGRKTKWVLQQGGPHVKLVDATLKAVGLGWNDISVVWVKDLMGPNGPAEAFRKDTSIDVCCVVTPDLIGLCGGPDTVGKEGAEGNVGGCHMINSTFSMNHAIADCLAVRKDYYDSHKKEVEALTVGYFKGCENLMTWLKTYDNGKGKSKQYMDALAMCQQIFGQEFLPTLEVDAHGFVLDADFARIPGNDYFFNDAASLIGFMPLQKSALALTKTLGYIDNQYGFEKASFDYRHISDLVGVKYVAPVMTTGRMKVEVTDFEKDLDSSTIFHFDIKFKPEQDTFPVELYAADFQRVCENSQTFGNAAILIRGHADVTIALQNFVWAAQAKQILTGKEGAYNFKGQPLDIRDTSKIIEAIQSENFAGLKRRNKMGQTVDIDDPRATVVIARQLSQKRAIAVKTAIEEYAKAKGLQIDLSQIQPQPVGVAEPINPRPRNQQQAEENMRVEFRVVKQRVEALNEDSFNFDN